MLKSILASTVLVLVTACGANPESSTLAGNPAAASDQANLHCHSRFAFTTFSSTVDIVGFKTGLSDEVGQAILKVRNVGTTTTTTFQVTSAQTKAYSVHYASKDGKFLLRGLDQGRSSFDAELILKGQSTAMVCNTPK